jgi:hypothetical protein
VVADWDAVIEGFVRRNAVVHAAGRVDGEYVRRLPKSIPAPVIGASLHCSHEYLLEVLDRLLAVGSALPLLIFQKLRPGSLSMSTAVSSVVTQLERHRYADAEALASVYLKALPDLPDEDQEILRVNIWMARREQGVSVEDDVRQWAPTDRDSRWELARACLLLDLKRTQLALEDLRGSGGTPVDVETWPLVVDMARRFPELRPVFRQGAKPRPRVKKRRRR